MENLQKYLRRAQGLRYGSDQDFREMEQLAIDILNDEQALAHIEREAIIDVIERYVTDGRNESKERHKEQEYTWGVRSLIGDLERAIEIHLNSGAQSGDHGPGIS